MSLVAGLMLLGSATYADDDDKKGTTVVIEFDVLKSMKGDTFELTVSANGKKKTCTDVSIELKKKRNKSEKIHFDLDLINIHSIRIKNNSKKPFGWKRITFKLHSEENGNNKTVSKGAAIIKSKTALTIPFTGSFKGAKKSELKDL